MPHFLLSITKRKWDKLDVPWLQSNDIQGDPLGDLRLNDGTLSVWHVEDDKSNLDIVITALAVTRQNFDKFEYALFDQRILGTVGIRFENNPGNTPFENANSWHRDLIELTVDKVTNLVKAIFGTLQKERLLQNDIKDRILLIVQHPPHPDPLPPGEREYIAYRHCLLPLGGGGLRWGGEPLRILDAVKGGLIDLKKVNKSMREKIKQLRQ